MRRYVVGVAGASGSLCARSVLHALIRHPEIERVHVVLSRYALPTLKVEVRSRIRDEASAFRALTEEGSKPVRRPARGGSDDRAARAILHGPEDMAAVISSGSYPADGMVVVPCSGGTLAAIANGVSSNLLQRAAEVTLKERRPLILAFRETPLSLVHIENMRRVTRAGAVVYPLTPAFYTRPQGVDAILEQLTARILDLLQLPHSMGERWGSSR